MPRRRFAVLFLAVTICTAGVGAGHAASVSLDGTWIGSLRDGTPTVWQLDTGRLRRDGRPADYQTRGDSLIVHFDASDDDEPGEVAVYRFYASDATVGQPRLFVYGFDLGKQGIHLVRDQAAKQPPAEDAAPEPPPVPPAPPSPAPPLPSRSK